MFIMPVVVLVLVIHVVLDRVAQVERAEAVMVDITEVHPPLPPELQIPAAAVVVMDFQVPILEILVREEAVSLLSAMPEALVFVLAAE
jgi:hypothetical protein